MTTPLYFVGLDVGGTTMKAGVVDDCGKPVAEPISLPTEPERGQDKGLERMDETIRLAVSEAKLKLEQIAAIGVATPGTMDIAGGIILDPPNLKPWRNVHVRRHIERTFKLPTAFQNDANAAAYGEYWVGAGKDVQSMVLFTLGTGIGGGIIMDDRVLEGQHSHGGELGHMRIEMTNPRLCGCNRRGCLEAYASASSVVKRTFEALDADGGKSALHGMFRSHGELTAKDVFIAADKGDALAKQLVDQTAYYLAVGTTNMLHSIDPDMVAFAGGMTAAGESFIERIRHYVRELAFPVPAERTEIRYALLGSHAGFIGAAGCGRQVYQRSLEGKKG
ncbi:MAG: ROK family protein [Planctomycetia bacterium]|nr:ROK family protein [Planctomycetia bacterium]